METQPQASAARAAPAVAHVLAAAVWAQGNQERQTRQTPALNPTEMTRIAMRPDRDEIFLRPALCLKCRPRFPGEPGMTTLLCRLRGSARNGRPGLRPKGGVSHRTPPPWAHGGFGEPSRNRRKPSGARVRQGRRVEAAPHGALRTAPGRTLAPAQGRHPSPNGGG